MNATAELIEKDSIPKELNELVSADKISTAAVLFEQDGMDPLLAEIRKHVREIPRDITTPKGREAVASLAYKIARSKTFLDELGKEHVADLKAKVKNVDAVRKTARDTLDELKKEVRQELDEYEAEIKAADEEMVRVTKLAESLELETSEELRVAIDELKGIDIAQFHEEKQFQVEAAIDQAIRFLDGRLEKQQEFERLQREEAKRKEEEEARLEAERQAREEEERKAAEQRAEEERKAKEEQERKDAEERARREEKEEAERRAREQQAAQDEARRLLGEIRALGITDDVASSDVIRNRMLRHGTYSATQFPENFRDEYHSTMEQVRKQLDKALADLEQQEKDERERKEAEARAANEEHRWKIDIIACDALVVAGLSEDDARTAIEAIAKGDVPNVTISY